MAKVIAVVGAGGKSSYIESLADGQGGRVCITTTTHIFAMPDRMNISYIGRPEGTKLAYPGDEEFRELCGKYDVVLVEADGSRHRPLKIPAEYEPVIPENVNEIVVVMGLHSLGRKLGEVCHRVGLSSELDPASPVTPEIIDFIAEHYYLTPLHKKFPATPIKYVRNNLYSSLSAQRGKSIALVLMASGSSRRFRSDKLRAILHGRELYRYGLEALREAVRLLASDGIRSEVFMTVRSPEGLKHEGVSLLVNASHSEGIAASVRLGSEAGVRGGFDGVLFLAGDMPNFPGRDVAGLVREFLCSGKDFGCAYSDYPSNPAVFSSRVFPELLTLSGDKGALRLINRNPERAHYYVVNPEKLIDIDTFEDLERLKS